MTALRLFAIIGIFFCTMIAWFILGGTISSRTNDKSSVLGHSIEENWGGTHKQFNPKAYIYHSVDETYIDRSVNAAGQTIEQERTHKVERPKHIEFTQSKITTDLQVDYRQKGLLWYSVYKVKFEAVYTVQNTEKPNEVWIEMLFPSPQAIYDDFEFKVNDKDYNSIAKSFDESGSPRMSIALQPNEKAVVHIQYVSQGTGTWQYSFGENTQRVRDFELHTDLHFDEFNIPDHSMSPTERQKTNDGWALTWKYSDLISKIQIGVEMPKKLNPGPTAERISFFAPVSLLFFFTILIIMGAITGNNIHPMNYFFLAGAFFSFNLLFAYLVDHFTLSTSFAISALTSMALVGSYMRLVTGLGYTLWFVLPTQFVYLILFSFSFFFEGYTGLSVTIGAVLTLFVLMQKTGGMDWTKVFENKALDKK